MPAQQLIGRPLTSSFALFRERHPQARHVLLGVFAGAPDTTVMSMSDDGELQRHRRATDAQNFTIQWVGEIVVAVVRYFGGIKLGTGGLQRAYSDAVSGVVDNLPLTLKVPREPIQFCYDYNQEAIVRHVLSHYDIADEQI